MKTSQLPKAYIVHQLRGRVRLRIKQMRQDEAYFSTLGERLESLEGVVEVRSNPNTGSLLLVHPEVPFPELEGRLRALELFEIVDAPGPQESALMPVFGGVARIDRGLAEESAGNYDLRTLAIIGLVGVSVYQIYRGNIVGPAVPMLLSALDLAQQVVKSAPDSET